MTERDAAVTMKGSPKTLLGDELKVGDPAPAFKLTAVDFSEKTLQDYAGKVKLLVTVPSLDTDVCDAEIRRFNQEVGGLGDGVVTLVASMDLPMAQKRWCGHAEASNVHTLSDFMDHAFGTAYGVRIKEMGLLARTVMVIDRDDKLAYVQVVKDVADEPDYDAALAAAKSAAA
ncbi:thiol peroxidase [Phycisphaera mikurensis]|uniref:Thiol peroxidase n=1 Tax=Phycisphaera mikurensis (strain NBRC 102666 / KCTC 22515 / FYK2301M01) TaxID=1142394 RepID=I0ICL5_PHYMF|nr:thiol peroxidase [Phycisphaera mikurensis]MBB6442122.1 thiol peroxidase [Phycisphaera mikurensis]BAM03003.1 thiol peroxidase [Phycisphaera mikurensis NBRC 102666]